MQHLQGIESNVQMVKIIFLYILSKSTTAFRIYLVRTHTHTHVLKVTACTCVYEHIYQCANFVYESLFRCVLCSSSLQRILYSSAEASSAAASASACCVCPQICSQILNCTPPSVSPHHPLKSYRRPCVV